MRLAVGLGSASLVVLFGGPFPSARAELRAAPQTQAPVQQARPPAAQPPRDVSAPKTGTAVIRGRITDGETGRPLRRARLTVASPELGRDSRIVNTNAEGRYEVKDLPAGRYTVSVRRGGYLPLRYGQRRPYEQGKPLEIADKQVVERIDFALPRMSVISGRVTDETGDPIENVNVMALRSMFFNGRRQLVPTGGLQNTDDVGEYRISGLVPGTYLVMARASDKWIVDVNGREETMGYTPTYYPGIDRVADARKITIGVGKEAAAIDFSLIPGRGATVSGTAYTSKGQPFNRVSLGQEIRGDGFASFGGSGGGSSVVAPDGTFSIPNITPGDYKLTASTIEPSGPGPETEVALLRLVVEGSDITGISLMGSGGGTVRGQLTTDDGSALPRNVRLTIQERLAGQPDPLILGAFRNAGIATVQDAGTFEVQHVFSPARFEVTPPDGWAVKTITQNSRDITDQPVQVAHGQELSGVEVVLTSRLTTVTGELTDEKGAPADGTLIVFAADSAKWFDGSRFIRATRPDQAGRSQIKGLPPGEYLAVGVDYVEDGMWNDTEYLVSIREHGRRLTLREGETQSLSVKVVP